MNDLRVKDVNDLHIHIVKQYISRCPIFCFFFHIRLEIESMNLSNTSFFSSVKTRTQPNVRARTHVSEIKGLILYRLS